MEDMLDTATYTCNTDSGLGKTPKTPTDRPRKVGELQSYAKETADSPEGTLSNKCLKPPLELIAQSFTLYEYAHTFGAPVEEGVKRVTPSSAHYYTHLSSC